MTTCASSTARRPISARSPMTTCGPMAASGPIFAVAATTAVGCTPGSGRHGRWKSSTAATKAAYGSDRKSTRLNSSHVRVSYAVFCLKKKKNNNDTYHLDYTVKEQLHLVHQH